MSNENAKAKISIDPRYVIRLTGTLLGICAVVALLLGAVNHITKPVIDQMQAEKTAAAMAEVLVADDYLPIEGDFGSVTALYEAIAGGECVGYVAQVSTNGFGGAINMVVGVNADGTVSGVAVTKHTETGNIGTKVVNDPAVLARFVGMTHADGEITVNEGANRFDGISGATVSSRGVTAGVNAALSAVGSLN